MKYRYTRWGDLSVFRQAVAVAAAALDISGEGGRRLDYALLTLSMIHRLVDCKIQEDVEGSDHFPIQIDLSTGQSER